MENIEEEIKQDQFHIRENPRQKLVDRILELRRKGMPTYNIERIIFKEFNLHQLEKEMGINFNSLRPFIRDTLLKKSTKKA